MRILKWLLGTAAGIAVALVVIGLLLPRKVHVERSTTVALPRANVFALLNSYRLFQRWSPWHRRDPQARYTFAGPERGVGASLAWDGDPLVVGAGRQSIVASQPVEQIKMELDRGDKGKAVWTFTLTSWGEKASSTRVSWSSETDLGTNLVARYVGLGLGAKIGADLEEGLAAVKTLAESFPKTSIAELVVEEMDASARPIAVAAAAPVAEATDIARSLAAAQQVVASFLSANGLKVAGHSIAIYKSWAGSLELASALPYEGTAPETAPDSPVKLGATYAGKALRVVHKGSSTELPARCDALLAWMAVNGLERAGDPWAEAVTDPATTPAADLVTYLLMPVRRVA